ncbi:MAG TPA: class I SAM-dependent methyltransferase [Vicinamibacteria bacterium]
MTQDSRERFTDAAQLYERHRPSYPAALIDWIGEASGVVPPAAVADLGCGTGISTRLLADRGYDVVGLDPNEAMLEKARAAGGARYQRGEAAAMGLPEGSVELVTVAQAFHWFELGPTFRELRRVLRPGGWCCAFWNVRASSPFMDAYDALLRSMSTEYAILESHPKTMAALAASPEVVDQRRGEFPNLQEFDWEGLHGRAWSSSYVLHGVADREGFDRALRGLFDTYRVDGKISYLYNAQGLCFRLAPAGVPA